jgi:SAM-dependent methyltransferase
VAPELCFLKKFEALENIEYITADLESPWAKVHFDIHEIPFEENTFDVIICNHLLEHVEDEQLALREMYRVMKPGGWGVMQSPINPKREVTHEDKSIRTPKEREKMYGQNDHVRDFGLDYPEKLKGGGFKVVVDAFVKDMPEEQVARYALLTGGALTVNDYIYRVEKYGLREERQTINGKL